MATLEIVTGSLAPTPRSEPALSVPPATFRHDPVLDRCWWSPQLCRLYGYPPGVVTPGLELLLAHAVADDRVRLAEVIRVAGRFGHPFVDQHRILTADGASRTVVVAAGTDAAEGGAAGTLYGFVVDVTAVDTRPERPADQGTVVRQLQEQVDHLRQALRSRDLIGQVKGMVRLIADCDEDTAWTVLVKVSQSTNRKAADLATELIDGFTGRRQLSTHLRAALKVAVDEQAIRWDGRPFR